MPQLLGHTTFNWALRHLPAALVAIALLGEPVGSAGLAFAFLHESPASLTILGAALILTGILVAARGAPADTPRVPEPARARNERKER